MTKEELQNNMWASLSDDLKMQLRNDYKKALEAFKLDPRNVRIETHVGLLINYFGKSNIADSDTEPKPKFMVGDMVITKVSRWGYREGWIGKITKPDDDGVAVVDFGENGRCFVGCNDLAPYTEPTATEGEEEDVTSMLRNELTNGIDVMETKEKKKLRHGIDIDDEYYEYQRMELAAKIAVVYAEKDRYEPAEIGAKAVEVANGVVERLKNSKR